jgi:hypothetical protein
VPSEPLLSRLLPDGHRDRSFGTDGYAAINRGKAFGEATAVAAEPGGDVLLGGDGLAADHGRRECLQVIRMTKDGSPDPSFGSDGVATLFCGAYEEQVVSIDLAPSGQVVVVVGNDDEIGVTELNQDGSPVRGFGDQGWYEMPTSHSTRGRRELLLPVSDAVLTPRGKILLAATGYLAGAVRVVTLGLLPDGRVDSSYGIGGWATAGNAGAEWYAESSSLLPGETLAVATTFGGGERSRFGAVAFDSDGNPERQFARNGVCRAKLPTSHTSLGIVALGDNATAVSDGSATGRWLLHCPLNGWHH